MSISLYNTMTNKKEEFKPIHEGKVGMYVCGVTVYDYTHIGHGRSSVAFDVIRRYFEYCGYDVTFVKNFTDVDDKIINRANENKELWSELALRFIKEHDEDMDSLYIKRPTYTPMATKYIEKMINYCERLIEKGNAYAVDGDVYFRVNSFKEYGKLSGRNLDDMMAGARVDVNDKKENPLDFALWKGAKEGEPFWESPWGKGRPGWHIECSVMSEAILGSSIDIHGGGQDLIFPHHENEIAQSEAISCTTFANYWIHNGFVNINKEKMSKSLNNFFTIRDILKICHSEALRLLFLMTHYRQPLEYSEDKLKEATAALQRIYTFLDEVEHIQGSKKGKNMEKEICDMKEHFIKEFESAMSDDFNTPKAVAAIFEIVRIGNTVIASKPDNETAERLKDVTAFIFNIVSKVLGIMNHSAKDWYISNLKVPLDEVESLIAKRAEARKNKDFALADSIRAELTEKGVEIIDTIEGTRFRTIS